MTAIVEDPTGVHDYGIRSVHVLLINVLESRTLTHTEIDLVPVPAENPTEAFGRVSPNQEEVVFGDCTRLVVAYE